MGGVGAGIRSHIRHCGSNTAGPYKIGRNIFARLHGLHDIKGNGECLSSDEIVNAFQAITTQEREYITKEELYAHLTREMADYCLGKMKGYSDPRTGPEVSGACDYMEFTRTLFQT